MLFAAVAFELVDSLQKARKLDIRKYKGSAQSSKPGRRYLAVQITEKNMPDVAKWCRGLIVRGRDHRAMLLLQTDVISKYLNVNDWIAQDVKSGIFIPYNTPGAFLALHKRVLF